MSSRVYVLLIFLLFIFGQVNTQTSVAPSVIKQSNYLQTGILLLTQTSTLSRYTYSYPYKYPKTLAPFIILSYGGVDYNLNKPSPSNSSIYLNINLYTNLVTSSSFIAQAVVLSWTQVLAIKYSYLIIDQAFPYYSAFDAKFISFPNRSYYFTFLSPYSNPVFVTFLWGLNYEIATPYPSTLLLGLHWEIRRVSSSSTQFYLWSFAANYNFLETKAIFLAIYTNLIPSDTYQIYTYIIQTSLQTSQILATTIYDKYFSNLMFGLTNFYIVPTPNSAQKSFHFNLTYNVNGFFQLNNEAAFSNITMNILVINRIQCPNDYPFKKLNTSTNLYECYSSCLSTQFPTFDTTLKIYKCVACTQPCVSCFSAIVCTVCPYYMDLKEDGTCLQKPSYGIVSGTIDLCSNLIPGCLTCTPSASTCLQCQNGYTIDASGCSLCSTLIHAQCIKCTTTYCVLCSSGYYLSSPTLCLLGSGPTPSPLPSPIICRDSNCSKCQSLNLSLCVQCVDQQLSIINGTCSFRCGDGKLMGSQQCDDNNTQNYDGCSNQCVIENDFRCSSDMLFNTSSRYYTSICLYRKEIIYEVKRILKIENKNKINIQIIVPVIRLKNWQDINFDQIFKFQGSSNSSILRKNIIRQIIKLSSTNGSRLLVVSDNIQNELVTIQIQYNETLQKRKINLVIDPKFSGLNALSSVLSYQKQILIVSENNQLVNYYSQSQYQKSQLLSYISKTIGFGSLALVILGIFVGNMLVAMQLIMLIQISYILLLSVGQLNPFYYGLTGLKYSLGFNLQLSEQIISESNKHVRGIGFNILIENNFNICLMLIILPIIVFGGIKLIMRIIKNQQLKQKLINVNYDIIGSITFYLIICFTPLISISIFINFIYATLTVLGYIIMTLSLLLVIGYTVFFMKSHNTRYFNKINSKIHNYKRIYLLFGLFIRIILSSLIVLLWNIKYCGVIILGIYLIYSLILWIKIQPYKNSHKIRLILNHSLFIIISIIYSLNNLISKSYNSSDPDRYEQEQQINMYLPYSIIILLSLILIINLLYYIYSIKLIRCCQLQIDWQKKQNGLNQYYKKHNQEIKQILKQNNTNDLQKKPKQNKNDLLNKNNIQNLDNQQIDQMNQTQKGIKTNIINHISNKNNKLSNYQTNPLQDQQISYNKNQNLYDQQNQLIQNQPHFKQRQIPKNRNLSPLNRQILQQQIKKQLKSNSIIISNYNNSNNINNWNDNKQLNHKLNKQINNKLINTDQIYRNNMYKINDQSDKTSKYQYTKNDQYCIYEQYQKL